MNRPIVLCVTSPYEGEITQPLRRLFWANFVAGRLSTHSSRAATLPFLIRKAERKGIPYVLTGVPGVGYTLRRAEELQEIKNYDDEN